MLLKRFFLIHPLPTTTTTTSTTTTKTTTENSSQEQQHNHDHSHHHQQQQKKQQQEPAHIHSKKDLQSEVAVLDNAPSLGHITQYYMLGADVFCAARLSLQL